MEEPVIINGRHIMDLQNNLLLSMGASEVIEVIAKAQELMGRIPAPDGNDTNIQGLLLGLVQSGKTNALISGIAMAADNG